MTQLIRKLWLSVLVVLLGFCVVTIMSHASSPKNWTHAVTLSMHFSRDMGGGGDMQAVMNFTSVDLCRSVRRAMWTALKDADGDLGDCVPVR